MQTISIGYVVDGAAYDGVLVYDETIARMRPAVLLAPDWMGVSEQAIASARRIAEAGFVMFVADIYGKGRRPSNPDEAAAMADPLKSDVAEARRRASGALRALRLEGDHRGLITRAPPAAVGFCFGGANVLELCRGGTELTAAVSIHGDLAARQPTGAGAVKPPVLVLHGAADPVAPQAQRHAFEAEMNAAGARWSMMVFGGVVHSFTDPGAAFTGVAKFDETASRWAFRMTEQFLIESFQAAEPG